MAEAFAPPSSTTRTNKSLVKSILSNGDLLKVMLADGLLACGTVMSPASPLVMVELRAHVWQDHMAEYTAIANVVNGILSMCFSGQFGRFSDRIDRRIAMAVVGVIGFVPTWTVLVLGQNALGLGIFTVLSSLGGVACITVTGCPTGYALVCDVIPEDEREAAFGCVFAGVACIGALGNLFGLLVNGFFKGSPQAVLIFVCCLQLLYFLCLSSIRTSNQDKKKSKSRLPEAEAAAAAAVVGGSIRTVPPALSSRPGLGLASKGQSQHHKSGVPSKTWPASFKPCCDASEESDASLDLEAAEDTEYHRASGLTLGRRAALSPDGCESDCSTVSTSSSSEAAHKDADVGGGVPTATVAAAASSACRHCFGPMRLLRDYPALANLCAVAAFVCLPEVTLSDVSGQFALSQFGLMGSASPGKQQEVTLIFQWPGFVLLLPSFIFVGFFTQRVGAQRALTILIPIIAISLSTPVLLHFLPRLWLAALVGLSIPMSMVVFTPLQAFVMQVSPPGRVGEAMGSIGAAKQVGGLLSNGLVSGLTPLMLRSGLEKPLWLFFPLTTACAFIALFFVLRIKVPKQDVEPVPSREATDESDSSSS
mmetsp:Transcript_54611/g.119553  ORF Transcript_54611/g.119553 Transcript_54611/m.119553 type:complete len:593 (-) Transcript_54611:88-1866(-)